MSRPARPKTAPEYKDDMKRNQETFPMACTRWIFALTAILALAAVAPAQQADAPDKAPQPDATDAPRTAAPKTEPGKPTADQPDKQPAQQDGQPSAPDGQAEKPKTILFQYDGVDYADVVREFAQFVGKPIIGDINLTGKLTFFDSEPYTLDEAWDTINLILSYRGYQLMPSDSGRHLELVPMKQVPKKTRIILDLERAGKLRPGEIVTAVVPLQYIDADSAATAVMRMVSAWGSITKMPRGKGLIVTDRVADIEKIRNFLSTLDVETIGQRTLKTYTLKHASAASVSEILKALFAGTATKRVAFNKQTNRYETVATQPAEVTINHDERTNTLVLLGQGEALALAENVIERLDNVKSDQAGDIRIFELSKARAEDLAKTISEAFPAQKIIRDSRGRSRTVADPSAPRIIPDSGTNRLIVSAPVEEMGKIENLIQRLDAATELAGGVRIFPLSTADAQQMVSVVTNAVSTVDARGRRTSKLAVTADPRTNAIIVSGPAGEIKTAEQVIKQLDADGQVESRETHVVQLETGEAKQLAPALVRLFAQQSASRGRRGQPAATSIKVEPEPTSNSLIISAAPGQWPAVQEILTKLKDASARAVVSTRQIRLAHARAQEVAETVQQLYGGGSSRRGRGRRTIQTASPVIVTASVQTNSLVVSAGQEDHAAIASLVEKLDVEPTEVVEPIRMVRLQAADAEKVASRLKNLLPPVRRGQEPEVYIETDPLTNALLLRAPESKREMLEKLIGQLDAASLAEARETRMVPLEFASAAAVASTVNRLIQPTGGSRSRRGSQPAAEDRPIVTPAPGDRAVVIDAPRAGMQRLVTLVESLDSSDVTARTEVRIYQLEHSTAAEVAQSLGRLFARPGQGGRRGRGNPPAQANPTPAPKFEADSGTNQLLVSASSEQFTKIEAAIEKLAKAPLLVNRTETFLLEHVKAADLLPVFQSILSGQAQPTGSRRRPRRGQSGSTTIAGVRFAVLESANALVVQASPEKLELVASLVRQFDTADVAASSIVKVIELANAQAESVAASLREMIPPVGRGESPTVFVTADKLTNSVLLRAPADQRKMLEEMIATLDANTQAAARETRVLGLQNASAAALVAMLQQLYPETASQPDPRRRRRGAQPQVDPGERVILTAAPGDRAIVVEAPANRIDRIEALIQQLDTEKGPGMLQVRTYQLDGSQAPDVARSLSRLFAEQQRGRGRTGNAPTGEPQPRFEADPATNQLLVAATSSQFDEIEKLIEQLRTSAYLAVETRTFRLEHARAEEIEPVLSSVVAGQDASSRRGRRGRSSGPAPARIEAVAATNSLVVQASPDKLVLAEKLIAQFDVPEAGGASLVQILPLTNARAETVAASLQAMLPPTGRGQTPDVFVHADPAANAVLLRAPAEKRKMLEALVAKLDNDAIAGPREIRMIELKANSASAVAAMLNQLFPGSSASTSRSARRGRSQPAAAEIVITAAPGDKTLVIEAPTDKIEEMVRIVDRLETGPGAATVLVKTYQLKGSQAADVARSMQRLFAQQRGRGRNQPASAEPDPRFEADAAGNQLIVAATSSQFETIDKLVAEMQEAPDLARQTETFQLTHAQAGDLQGVLESVLTGTESSSRRGRRGSQDASIRIAAVEATNALVVQAPPAELELARDLIGRFDVAEAAGSNIVQVIELENAKAATVAAALEAMRPPTRRGEPAEIFVHADELTNSVLLRAPAEKRKTLEEMIARLDAKTASAGRQQRVLRLRHASAAAVADMVGQLYPGGDARRRGRGSSRDADRVVVTAGPDDRTLVIDAPRQASEQIAALIDRVDTDQAGGGIQVRTYDLRNAVDVARSLQRIFQAPGRRGAGGAQPRFEADALSGQLIAAATAAQFDEIDPLIEQLQKKIAVAAQTRTFPLQHAQASEIAALLEQMINASGASRRGRRGGSDGQARVAAMPGVNAVVVQAGPEQIEMAAQLIATFDTAEAAQRAAVQVVGLDNADAASLAETVNAALSDRSGRRGRGADGDEQVVVTPEPHTNALLVRGPSNQVASAIEMIRRFDSQSQPTGLQVRVYKLENSEATVLAESFEQMFRDLLGQQGRNRRGARPTMAITADARTNSLVVTSTPAYFALVEDMISKLDQDEKPLTDVRIVTLDHADAYTVADQLDAMFLSRRDSERPVIEPEMINNTLTIVARDADMRQIDKALAKLDVEDNTRHVRVVTLTPNANAASVAQALQRLYGELAESDVRVIEAEKNQPGRLPGGPQFQVPAPEASDPEDQADADVPFAPDVEPADAGGPVANEDRDQAKAVPDATDTLGLAQVRPPVIISVDRRSNSLVLSGTQRELAEIEDLIGRLTSSEMTPEATTKVYRIQQADPAGVAETLSRLFNPPKRTAAKNNKNKKNQPVQQAEVLTAVADQRTRSVIVRAEPQMFELIDPLVKHLDQISEVISEVRVFTLKNTRAETVAENLRDIFRLAGEPGGGGGKGRKSPQQDRAAELTRQLIELRTADGVSRVDTATQVSVTANENTNSVVIAAPAEAMQLIESLIQELDQSAVATRSAVRMYPLAHAEVGPTVTALREIFAEGSSPRGRGPSRPASEGPVVITGDTAGRQILVSARPEQHELISQVIEKIDQAQAAETLTVRVYSIRHGDAGGIAGAISTTLAGQTAGRGRRGQGSDAALRISFDTTANAIVVRGTVEDHRQVADIVERMDKPALAEAPVRMIPLSNADVAEVAEVLNRLYSASSPIRGRRGGSGSPTRVIIEADASARLLMVRADDETFEKIRALAGRLDEATPAGSDAPSVFPLKNAQATTVAAMLSQAFAPQRGRRMGPEEYVTIAADATSNVVIVNATGRKLAQAKALIERLDSEVSAKTRTEMVVLQHARASEVAEVLGQVAARAAGGSVGRRGRPGQPAAGVLVTAETASNAVVLTGPEGELTRLMEMAVKLDRAGADAQPLVKMYDLANADVATMVAQLQQIFPAQASRGRRGRDAEAPVTVVGDSTGGRVIVSAPAAKHKLIAQVIADVDASHDGDAVTLRIHKIENGDAASMAQALSTAWSKSAGSRRARRGSEPAEAVRITADRGSNSIVVRAPGRDHAEIARLIGEMDVSPQDAYPVQSIPLVHANAENLARILSSVFDAQGSSRGRRSRGGTTAPVVIEADTDSRMLLVRADEETFARIRALAGQMDAAGTTQAAPTVIPLTEGRAESLAASLNQAFAPQRGRRLEPEQYVNVVAEPTSNTLIVTANQENLARVRQLLASMLAEGAGGVRTELVLLKNAKAVDLADVLERIATASTGSSGSRRGRRGQASAQSVTISPDAASNALLMSGPAGELDKMMKMALQLDQAVTSNGTGAYIIPLANGQAEDVAATVENLYRAQADAARRDKRSIDPLAVSADTRANAVVLATSESMYRQVVGWVTELENMKPARGTMRIIPIQNADPAEVEKAIQQMFDQQSSSTPSRRNRRRRNDGGGTRAPAGQVETSVLEKQRAIMVTASEEDYKAIAEMVRALDRVAALVEKKTQVIALENATNTRVAQALNALYADQQDPKKQVKVNALAQTNALVISAAPDRLKEVADLVAQLDKPEVSPQVQVRIYPLKHAQPAKVLPMVQQVLNQVIRMRPGETFSATADERTRSIVVTAKQDVFDAVAEVIAKLDNPPAFATAQTRIFPLKKADAPRLAAVLTEMLRPDESGQVTPEARALQEQLRRMKIAGALQADTPELDLSKPIKITSDPAQTGQQGSNSLIVTSTGDNLRALAAVVGLLDVAPLAEGVRIRLVTLENADAASVMAILREVFDQGKRLAGKPETSVEGAAEPESTIGRALVHPLNISADLRTNTLVLAGIEESLALAEVVIEDLDKVKGKIETQVRLFRLEHVAVQRVAPLIEAIFAEQEVPEAAGLRTQVTRLRTVLQKQDGDGTQQGHTTALPRAREGLVIRTEEATNILIVAARSDVMPLIADVVRTVDLAGARADQDIRFYPLENADATRVQQVIESIFANRSQTAARNTDVPQLAVDTRTNALVVSASEKSQKAVASLVRRLDIETPIDLRDIQLIPLKNADAESLAGVLGQMMDARVQRQQSLGVKDAEALRVIVLPDPRSNSLIVGGSKESFDVVAELARKLDQAPAALAGQLRILPLAEANADTVARTLGELFDQRYAAARTPDVARQKPVILPDLRTNALLIAANADDTKVIESLLERLDVKLTDPAVRLEVVGLEHNDASIVGPTIQQIFEQRLESLTPSGAQPSPADRVNVAVDAMSNALIVSANKDNMDLIRSLVSRIDRQPGEKGGVYRLFALKNSDAQRVATMLENLVSQGLYKPGIGLVKNTPSLAWREQVSIAVDTRTNVLIISASEQNLAILSKIIDRIDAGGDYNVLGDVRVFALDRADATELAETLGQFFQAKRAAEQEAGSTGRSLPVSIVADARTNALLVAGSRESFAAIQEMIQRLDRKDVPQATVFQVVQLQAASAGQVADTLERLFQQRVTRGESADPFTVLPDALSNTLILGGSAEDMEVAKSLVASLDRKQGGAGQAVRVFLLEKADATQTAATIRQLYESRGQAAAAGIAISVDERTNALVVSGGAADLEYVGQLVDQLDRKAVTQVTEIRFFQLENADAAEMAEILTTALTNKPAAMTAISPNLQTMLQFVVTSEQGKRQVAQALEEGVLITPDERTNTLIVKARKDFMDLLARLIESLDSTDPRQAEIVVFPLENADARSMADVLSQLFSLEGAAPANKAVRYTLVSGKGADDAEGATLGSDQQHALRLTVDPRTNSLLVGGTRQYVKLVSQVIGELDSSPAQERLTKVYRLRNGQASQIEQALSAFLAQERERIVSTLGDDAVGAAVRLLEREVAVVAEEDSNSLLLSASPRYFRTVEQIIHQLDQPPPQVLIQVLLAELSLDDSTDLGVDWNYTDQMGSKTVQTGTNFGIEANFPGLTGLTLSVTGGDLSFFLRALQSQGKLQVLSRPQILASDNQEAEINVGQSVPFITQSSISDSGRINNTIEYQDVGILLNVTPRINEDGFVRLEVEPEVSSLSQSTVQVSENVNAVIVNRRSARTTVTVQDGHTIVLGGLITTTDEDRLDKVPILGDIPLAGSLFRSTRTVKRRSELLIVLKPTVLRTTDDVDDVSQPQLDRIEGMDERVDTLRKAIINSLQTDPEMRKAVRRELDKRRPEASPVKAVPIIDRPRTDPDDEDDDSSDQAGDKPGVPLESVAP